jgi:glycosyltransferase involved in cell wall biosynthesis
MSRVLVVTSAPPLAEGGHLVIARALVTALREAGHASDIVTTPSNRFGRQGPAYLANWLTDVGMTGTGERVDQIITLRFPSYAVRHTEHVCWLNHTMREYYDRWDDWSGRLSPQGRLKELIRRRLIHAADSYFFKQHVRRLFAQSEAVRARLQRWNHVESEVLHPPAPPRPYRCDGYGDYLFFASRLTALKRADLVIRALAEPAARHVRLVVGGDGEDRARLITLARELGVDSRVTFTGQLSEADLIDHLAKCRAVVFPPADEDYGFVTVEAFAAGKAVVTCTDSGGPLDLAKHEQNALVVAPTPAAMAGALAQLMDSKPLAEKLGAAALATAAPMTWPAALKKLVIV